MGRPKRAAIDFEDDVVKEILERTEKGEPLTRICSESRMPSRATVYEWIEADQEFSGRFRAARARGVHALAEECLSIADKPSKDAVEVSDKRVRIDTRLRLAGKWLPSIYGDRVDVNHSGEVTTRHDLSTYSADELDALEKLVAKAADRSRDTGGEGAPGPDRLH
jgi:hypothetical protein